MKKNIFEEIVVKYKFNILGKFLNEHGEEFVVYKYNNLPSSPVCVATQDYDWEEGKVFNGSLLLSNEVMISREERAQIVEILNTKNIPVPENPYRKTLENITNTTMHLLLD